MIPAIETKKSDILWKISNPYTVQQNANKYYNNLIVYKSDKINKKYFIVHDNKKSSFWFFNLRGLYIS